MLKTTVYGLPLNPVPLLTQLAGASFCVSYGTRAKLGHQLDQAINLVGDDGILLVDNGAFSHFKSGGVMDEEHIEGFEAWAQEILDRCPQAIAVIPDVIGGSTEDNVRMLHECQLDPDRCMPIWHTNESIEYLLYLCESYGYIGIGTVDPVTGKPGTKNWHARMREVFAAIDKWEAECEGCYVRPRIHLMRAQAQAHLYPVDSSDSTNVAMNHSRQLKKSGHTIAQTAARVDAKIQASAGPIAEHQIKRPLQVETEYEHAVMLLAHYARLEEDRAADWAARRAREAAQAEPLREAA